MSKAKIGEVRAMLIEGGNPYVPVKRVASERKLQDAIRENAGKIFGKNVVWLHEIGKYGDMLGLREDGAIICVEIKAPKSKGNKKTEYGFKQIKNKVPLIDKEIYRSRNRKRKLIDIYIEYLKRLREKKVHETPAQYKKALHILTKMKTNLRQEISRILHPNLKLIKRDLKPHFYFISSQFQKTVLKKAIEWNSEKHKIGRWQIQIECINANVFVRSKKKYLVFTQYI